MTAGVRVLTPECPTTSDGRPMHVMWKVDGVFTCANCGAVDERKKS